MDTPRSRRRTWRSSSDASFRRMAYPALRPLQNTAQTYSSSSRRRALRVSLSSASFTVPVAISLCIALASMGSSMRNAGGARVSSWMARLSRPRRCPNSVTVGAWSARRGAALPPLCRPSSAAILHPVVSIGSSLNILKMPPTPPAPPPPPPPDSFVVRRPSEDGRRSDRSEAA
ncbi:Os08g0476650, partial [Oryza sativa Japonica Group]